MNRCLYLMLHWTLQKKHKLHCVVDLNWMKVENMPNEANKQPHRLPFSYHKTPQSHFIVKMLSNFSLHTWGVANESAAHETCLLNISGAYNMQHYWPMDTCQSMYVSLSLKLSLSNSEFLCVWDEAISSQIPRISHWAAFSILSACAQHLSNFRRNYDREEN
jgi:hypothetical protein